jgi:hypothetical protein
MPRTGARRLAISATVMLLAVAGGLAVASPAYAASSDITLGQTLTFTSDNGSGSATSSAGTIGAGTDNACQGGFINVQIPANVTNPGAVGTDGVMGSGATVPGTTCPVSQPTDSRGEGGLYRMMTNLWDDNTTWNCAQITGTRATAANCQGAADQKASSNLLLAIDGSKTTGNTGRQYEYNKFDANTYYPTGRPGFTAATCPQTGTFVDNGTTKGNTDLPCHWTPTQAHFPSSYPALYKGCNFAQCSFAKGTNPTNQTNGPVQASAALPTPLSSIVSLNSHWIVNLPTADGTGVPKAPGDGVYDVAYDIWLDRGDNTSINAFNKFGGTTTPETLPDNAYNLEQNNGAEVMLWINNSGYTHPGSALGNAGNVITPAGKFIGTYADSTNTAWDVWIGRQNMPDSVDANGSPTKGGPLPQWNCHYAQDKVTPLTNDSSNGTNNRTIPSAQNTHCQQWNIVTYVRQSGVADFQMDTSEFLFNALNYNAGDANLANNVANPSMTTAALQSYLAGVCPAQPNAGATNLGNTAPGQCISPNWWLTSVQTGMEVWNLPANGGSGTVGSKLGTKFLSVNPMTALGNGAATNTGITGRDMHIVGGTPTKYRSTIHFNDQWVLSYSGCPSPTAGATATYTINTTNPASTMTGTLTQATANTGLWESSPAVSPLNPGHDNTTISVSGLPNCGDPTPSGNVFVDPSGHVVTRSGMPINGATVTIGKCTTTNPAPNVACPPPALSQIMPQTINETTPATNPADGSGPGSFRWDVVTGLWTVTASAPGCNTVTLGPITVPPPQVGLQIVLDCATTAPGLVAVSGGTYTAPPTTGGGLPTQVVVRGGGVPPHGYCADIFVTNNTSAPVEWNTSFAVPGNQHINQMWNIVLTQGGNPNTATNVHADAGSQSWNKILQPGATTHDIGFCTVFS